MAVQVSWPGVYIDEFEPGAPIQGVGTSTPAFLGIAAKGPIKTPTRIFSWDEFVATFGGFLPDPGAWLAPAVYGFFSNGGTSCYIVRASGAKAATATLDARGSGDALVATAVSEGPAGNNIAIVVTDSSRSKAAVDQLMTKREIAAMVDRKTLTVAPDVGALKAGDAITVAKAAESQDAVVNTVTVPDKVELKADLAGNTDFTGGTATAQFTVRVYIGSAVVTGLSADRTTITLDGADHGFVPTDRIHVTKEGGDTADAVVKEVAGNVLTIVAPLAAGDFTGDDVEVRKAQLPHGARRLRLVTPHGLSVAAAFPRGSLLEVKPNAGAAAYVRVADSGGDELQLDPPGLPADIDIANQSTAPQVSTADFDVSVHVPQEPKSETFGYLSTDARSPGYWATAVASTTVRFTLPDALGEGAAGDDRPTAETKQTAGGTADDSAGSWKDLTETSPKDYLDRLAVLRDVSLVAVPGGTTPDVQQALIAHCESLKDRFAVLDAGKKLDVSDVMNQFAQVRSVDGYAALYYPWIQVRNPSTGTLEYWPPSGHVLGAYARTDADRGVHKAPANTNIRGALGVEKALSDQQQGPLNLLGINVIRVFPGQSQPQLWGARTTAGDLDTNWLYINVRRLFIYIEQSLERGIRWAVFEPNDLELWQKLKRSISDFLTQAWRDGALFGAKPEEAFYVRIDEVLNPPSTRALGRLYIEIGIVPTYPAEFIILRIGIWDGGSEITTS